MMLHRKLAHPVALDGHDDVELDLQPHRYSNFAINHSLAGFSERIIDGVTTRFRIDMYARAKEITA